MHTLIIMIFFLWPLCAGCCGCLCKAGSHPYMPFRRSVDPRHPTQLCKACGTDMLSPGEPLATPLVGMITRNLQNVGASLPYLSSLCLTSSRTDKFLPDECTTSKLDASIDHTIHTMHMALNLTARDVEHISHFLPLARVWVEYSTIPGTFLELPLVMGEFLSH